MKVAVGLRRVAAGKRTSGRRAAQIASVFRILEDVRELDGFVHLLRIIIAIQRNVKNVRE